MVIAERLPATLGGRAESTQNPFLATGSAEAHASKPKRKLRETAFSPGTVSLVSRLLMVRVCECLHKTHSSKPEAQAEGNSVFSPRNRIPSTRALSYPVFGSTQRTTTNCVGGFLRERDAASPRTPECLAMQIRSFGIFCAEQ
jgi:hypothetical protein